MTRQQKDDLMVELNILQGGVNLLIAMKQGPPSEVDIARILELERLIDDDNARRYQR